MFGLVNVNWKELTKEQQVRYSSVYCGICRAIKRQSSQTARLALQYDMAFLALVLMSLYEPEERQGKNACIAHPFVPRAWTENEYIAYAADMNVALAYYKALDDRRDDGGLRARLFSDALRPCAAEIAERYPRQCSAVSRCITRLSALEADKAANPDDAAAVFGELMAELMVYREDLWSDALRQLGYHLGRFIYLADAMLDYDRDGKTGSYNPFLAMGTGKNEKDWEQYLLLAMSRCTEHYEKLPLVQDKPLLDNILYSGVWVQYRGKMRKEDHRGQGSL